MPKPKVQGNTKYTYADYLTWPDDERWEIIDGVAYAMSPAPTCRHQTVSRNILYAFHSHLKDTSWQTLSAPLDVRFPSSIHLVDNPNEQFTVVQPDLLVVRDDKKLDEKTGKYTSPREYKKEDEIECRLLAGLKIMMSEIFD